MSSRRFRIAFSFAGEKRAFVAKVADFIAAKFGKDAILYDKYHEAEFARHDLGIYLPKLYREESDLIVPVLCPNYDHKRWTGWEWVNIYSLLTKEDGYRVMPCRFGQALADGLTQVSGFLELDHKTPEETAMLILERLANNERKPRDFFSATAVREGTNIFKPAIPSNLPRLRFFFGREKELSVISEILDPQNSAWGILIDGPGGIGKTSLAIRAAHDCKGGQFDRIVFISVKDSEMDDEGARPVGPFFISGLLEIFNELARELEHPDIPKAPEDQRVRLLLNVLHHTRTLLILDNLESLAKDERDRLLTFVTHLPHGCKAILTSRHRFGSIADTLPLEKLSREAALAIIDHIAQRNPLLAKATEAERVELYRQTGGKPLLLYWTAGQLGRGSCRTLKDALHFLHTCPLENDPVEFIFGYLAQEFTPDEENVLASLSYFTSPLRARQVTNLTGLREAVVTDVLNSLINRCLVVPDQANEGFSLVPLVAEFIQKHRRKAAATMGRRLQKHVFEIVTENGFENHARFPILEGIWAMIAASIPLFLAGQNRRLQFLCDALFHFFDFNGRWDEAIALNRQAEQMAVASKDYRHAGWRAYQMGYVYDLRRQPDEILFCGERALAHWKCAEAGVREEAVATSLIGRGYRLLRDHPKAIQALRRVLDLHRSRSAESKDVATALNALGTAELEAGIITDAQKHFEEAGGMAYVVKSDVILAASAGNLAAIALSRKEWEKAENLSRTALTISTGLGNENLIAADCLRLAEALIELHKPEVAFAFAKHAVELFSRKGAAAAARARELLAKCDGSGPKKKE